MFAVRSIFARPERSPRRCRSSPRRASCRSRWRMIADPLGFLMHPGGAVSLTDAAYRYVRHEPGVDVVLFGTGDQAHLRTNIESILRPPLPQADRTG